MALEGVQPMNLWIPGSSRLEAEVNAADASPDLIQASRKSHIQSIGAPDWRSASDL
ncbi:hypothetical protein CyaNS01_02433 [Cyanobium sp. NS01]|nr:hypothetical protein CyaNS01_02433 [Cyanobium sp. NS01]